MRLSPEQQRQFDARISAPPVSFGNPMTLATFQEGCRAYEEQTGQPVTSLRIDRANFNALCESAKAIAVYRVKGVKLPRNQVVIAGVIVVAR